MKTRNKRSSILTGLAMIGATLAATSDTHAAPTKSAISISGGIVQGSGGDPPYIYVFDVFVESGTWNPGALSFTIEGLVGVSAAGYGGLSLGSTSSQPGPLNPYNGETFDLTNLVTTPSTAPSMLTGTNYASDVTWSYESGPPLTSSGEPAGYIGQFTIETSWQNYAAGSPPIAPGTILLYTFSGSGGMGDGTINIQNGIPGVPEPSSIILMLAGATVLPYLAIRKNRGSRAPS
jgi:hypothetical protein